MSQKFKSISLRIPVELHGRFTATARDSDRSFNAAALQALQDYIHGKEDRARFTADFSALEQRVTAHLERIEAKLDHPLREASVLTADTEKLTTIDFERLKTQFRVAGIRSALCRTGLFPELGMGYGQSKSDGIETEVDIYKGTAESILKQQAQVDLKSQLKYWERCTCVKEIPGIATDQELIEYYEQHCTTCGRNYKHLETGDKT